MCYHPWVGLDINPQSEIKPCCKYSKPIAMSLDDYNNSKELAELKNQFLNGEMPDGCARCWKDEEAGLPSKRMLDYEYVFHKQQPNCDSVKVLSISFGNICNLACRTCGSYASSKWGTESKKLKTRIPDIKIFKHNTFYKDAKFISKLKELTKDVIRVDIPGGEPFFADKKIHIDFLTHLLEHNPGRISLHYITNGTIFPDNDMLEIWNHFKHVDIQVSLDGTGSQFEYARWPANWSNVESNLKRYVEYRNSNDNIQLSISHSVSVFTVYHLPEFLSWCETNNLPAPYLGLVSRPAHYNITILPEEAKTVITERFKNIELLDPIVKALWSQNNIEELDNFAKYVKILDTQRNQNFADVFPELYQLLGEKCQTLYQRY